MAILKLVQRHGETTGKIVTDVLAIVPNEHAHGPHAGLVAVTRRAGDPNVEFEFADGPIEVSEDE